MLTYARNGITIDQCTACRGIFLDRGELERLISAESSYLGGSPLLIPAEVVSAVPKQGPGKFGNGRWRQPMSSTVSAYGERRLSSSPRRGLRHQGSRLLKRVLMAGGLVATLLVVPSTFGTASAEAFSAGGTIYCSPSPVVGVWVSAGSASGWASFSQYGSTASYSKNIGWHLTYHLTVGCGGSPSHWATSNYEGANLWEGFSWSVVCSGRGACYAFDAEA